MAYNTTATPVTPSVTGTTPGQKPTGQLPPRVATPTPYTGVGGSTPGGTGGMTPMQLPLVAPTPPPVGTNVSTQSPGQQWTPYQQPPPSTYGGYGSMSQFAQNPGLPPGYTDLRGQQYGPSGAGTQVTNWTNMAGNQLSNAALPQWYGVSPANYAQAQGTLGQAIGATGGMNIGQFASMGPADYSKAQGLLGQAQGQVGGISMQNYGQIDPNQFKNSYGLLGQAQSGIPGQDAIRDFQGIGAGSYNPAADTQQQRAMAMQDLQSMHNSPDRAALAAKSFDLIQQQGNPTYERELRDVGAKAAALGRTGSGMTTNELTDVFSQRQRDLDLVRQQLANNAAGMTMQDRSTLLNATQGLYGQNTGTDLSNAGFQQGLRNEARDERGQALGYDFNKANYGLNRSAALSGLAQNYAGLDTEKRNEQVGERGFQAQQGMNQAQLAAQRESAYAGLGGQQADLSTNTWNQGFADRGFQADLAAQRAQLAGQRAGILSGIGGQQADIATNQYGQSASERDSQMNYGLNSFNADMNRLGALSGLESQRFGQAATNFQQQQQERDYQTNLAQQSWQNNYNQIGLQDQLQNSAFDRWQRQTATLGQYGQGGAPWDTMQYGANQYGNSAQNQGAGAGNALSQYAYNNAYGQGGAPGGASGYPNGGYGGQTPSYNQPPGQYNYGGGDRMLNTNPNQFMSQDMATTAGRQYGSAGPNGIPSWADPRAIAANPAGWAAQQKAAQYTPYAQQYGY